MAIARLNVVLDLSLKEYSARIAEAEKMAKKFGNKLKGIGRNLTINLTAPLVGAGAAAVKAFADYDKLQKGLEAVNSSSQAASDQFQRLRKIAENPGIGLEQAVAGAIRLQAIGIEAKEAENTLLQLSKAVALTGSAENLDSVVTQLAQITSKGKILQEDLGVILENAPALAGAFQDAFGTTNAEDIRTQVTNVTDFRNQLLKAIENSETFSKVQGSLSNSFNNFGTAVKFSLAQVGATIAKTINLQGILDRLSATIAMVGDGFANLSPTAQKVIIIIAGIAAAIGPLAFGIGAVMTILPTFTAGLATLSGVFTVLTGPIGATIAAIAAIAVLFRRAYNQSEEFREKIHRAGEVLQIFGKIAVMMGKQLFSLGKDIFTLFQKVFTGVSSIVGNVLGALWTKIKDFFGSFVDLSEISFSDIVASFVAFFSGLISSVKEIIKSITVTLKGFGGAFKKLLKGDFEGAFESFKESAKRLNPVRLFNGEGIKLGDAFREGYLKSFKETKKLFETPGNIVPNIDFNGAGDTGDTGGGGGGSNSPGSGASSAPTRQNISPLSNLNSGLSSGVSFEGQGPLIKEASEALKEYNGGLSLLQQFGQGAASTLQQFGLVLDQNRGFLVNFQQIGISAIESMSSSLQGFVEGTKSFGQAVVSTFRDITKSIVQAAVAKVILDSLSKSSLLGPLAVPLSIAAGQLAAAGIGAFLSGVGLPALAEGGLAFGPTAALVGDNRNAAADPEVIAPLSKLKGMLGGGGQELMATISGDDLLFVVRRAENRASRIE